MLNLIIACGVIRAALSYVKARLSVEHDSKMEYQFNYDSGDSYIGQKGQQLCNYMQTYFQFISKLPGSGDALPRSKREPIGAVTRHVIACAQYSRQKKNISSWLQEQRI